MIPGQRRKTVRRWLSKLTVQYTIFALVTAGIMGMVAMLLVPSVSNANARAVLTTLATAEASVLAIVFSVTVVALQLVVTRYSARLTSLFVNDPLFRTTFGLFVFAVAFNLVAVSLLPTETSQLTNAAVGMAFGLAVVATIALYRFIQLMIERSSPDELIAVLIERELAPAEYLPASAKHFEELAVHPLRPLYLIVTRAVELREYHTASQGIEGLQIVLTQTFSYLEENFVDEDATEFAAAVASEPLTDYFPPIIGDLYNEGQSEMVSQTVAEVESIGIEALERGYDDIAEDAAEGLGDAFDAAPLTWEGNRIRNPVKDTLVALAKRTAEQADNSTFRGVFHQLDHQVTVFLRRQPDRNAVDWLVSEYYTRDSVEIFEALIEQYAPRVPEEDTDWISPTEGRQWTLPSEAKPLREFWRDYTDFTETILQYRISEDEYPFAEGNIGDGWFRITTAAMEAGLTGLAILCCMTIIQLAYRLEQLEDNPPGLWTNRLANLRIDYDPIIVDQALEHLRVGEQPEGGSIHIGNARRTQLSDNRGMIERFLHGEEEQDSFENWVGSFESEIKERTESHRERE